ncbi:hypothetical protein [Hydrogenobaculum acidophilum]
MRHAVVLPRLLALVGAVMFVGTSAQASQQVHHNSAGISAKASQSYLLAEDNQQQKNDSEDDSNDSSDSNDE